MPALPLDEAGRYVAAAYVIFVLLLVVYIGIMAVKLGRISARLEELADLAEDETAGSRRPGLTGAEPEPEPAGRVRDE